MLVKSILLIIIWLLNNINDKSWIQSESQLVNWLFIMIIVSMMDKYSSVVIHFMKMSKWSEWVCEWVCEWEREKDKVGKVEKSIESYLITWNQSLHLFPSSSASFFTSLSSTFSHHLHGLSFTLFMVISWNVLFFLILSCLSTIMVIQVVRKKSF